MGPPAAVSILNWELLSWGSRPEKVQLPGCTGERGFTWGPQYNLTIRKYYPGVPGKGSARIIVVYDKAAKKETNIEVDPELLNFSFSENKKYLALDSGSDVVDSG